MSLRPTKIRIYIILHRNMGRVIDANDGTQDFDDCNALLLRSLPIGEMDTPLSIHYQDVLDAFTAIESAYGDSPTPSLSSLNSAFVSTLDDAGL